MIERKESEKKRWSYLNQCVRNMYGTVLDVNDKTSLTATYTHTSEQIIQVSVYAGGVRIFKGVINYMLDYGAIMKEVNRIENELWRLWNKYEEVEY